MGTLSELARVIHWGPLLALSVIAEITISGLYCLLQWWPPHAPVLWLLGGIVHLIVYLNWDLLILYHFFGAMYGGPGHVPIGWAPKDASTENLQYCTQCEGYKAPRSHHCRKCKRCVMKMDHHCPWINNCVGHRNHFSFTMFVFFAPLGCIHAILVIAPSLYRAINRNYYLIHGITGVPIVTLTPTSFFAALLGFSLAVGVTIAVEILCIIQLRSILNNETGIETWIKEKAEYMAQEEQGPEFVFPYNLGRWRNLGIVFYMKPRPELDGLWWPVSEGCDQYTLTGYRYRCPKTFINIAIREQIRQKREKKERSVVYTIKEAYSGSLFPITKGIRVCCFPPCTDEPRIPVQSGDRILVSRWKKRWLYGDKLLEDFQKQDVKRMRGWFPRRCAVEVYQNPNVNGQTSDTLTTDHNDQTVDAKKTL